MEFRAVNRGYADSPSRAASAGERDLPAWQRRVTGTCTIRISNPCKHSPGRDPQGDFIREWCPEPAGLPAEPIHQPSRLGEPERDLRSVDYPEPIVDIHDASRVSCSGLCAWRKRESVRLESNRVLQRHLRPDDNGARRGA